MSLDLREAETPRLFAARVGHNVPGNLGNKVHILLVDDHPIVREVLQQVVSRALRPASLVVERGSDECHVGSEAGRHARSISRCLIWGCLTAKGSKCSFASGVPFRKSRSSSFPPPKISWQLSLIALGLLVVQFTPSAVAREEKLATGAARQMSVIEDEQGSDGRQCNSSPAGLP